MKESLPYSVKSMVTNFLGSFHGKGFVAFSHAMRNWWGNPCTYRVMKYTIGWESTGKKEPVLWEKYEYQFLRFSPYNGFCCILPVYGKLTEKPMHFPCDEVYCRMGIGWKNVPILCEKYDYQFPRFSPYDGFCFIFPCYGILMRFAHFFLWYLIESLAEKQDRQKYICWNIFRTSVNWQIPALSSNECYIIHDHTLIFMHWLLKHLILLTLIITQHAVITL